MLSEINYRKLSATFTALRSSVVIYNVKTMTNRCRHKDILVLKYIRVFMISIALMLLTKGHFIENSTVAQDKHSTLVGEVIQ
jgi:hypothetical protein